MFDPAYPVEALRGAEYNPRKIDEASILALRESLSTLGVLRPVIAKSDGLLMAGHQRTKAMQAVGIAHCPAFLLDGVGPSEEIRFNQLHNASDVEVSPLSVNVPPGSAGEWIEVKGSAAVVSGPHTDGARRNEILRLLSRHGNWSAVIATETGDVLIGQLYASACKILGLPLLVRYVPTSDAEAIRRSFGRQYGEFSYGHLPKTTWVQTMAQKPRLRTESHSRSRMYENVVLPTLKKGERILDFGCGQGDYVAKLAGLGHDILGVEFYRRLKGKNAIDTRAVHRMIDAVCSSLRQRGLFDVVVCDSVLNSVDSLQAEADVLTCLNALCRPGGRIVFSGRSREYVEAIESNATKVETQRRNVCFLDPDGFTAVHQGTGWLYQKFHRKAEVSSLGRQYVGPDFRVSHMDSSWSVSGTKTVELDPAAASASLSREFNLPLPGGRSWGRSSDILAAWEAATTQASESLS